MDKSNLLPIKPYLFRAYYDWITDNQCTPHIVVDIHVRDVVVPEHLAEDGRIILNIAAIAVNDLQMTDEFLDFEARFKGVSQKVFVPMASIMGIYAHENQIGIMFAAEESDAASLPAEINDETPPPPPPKGKPTFKIVK